MIRLNDRIRRGLGEAIGIPATLAALILALLILDRVLGTVP